MNALIGIGAGAAYVAVFLFTARHLFRRWRAQVAQIRLCTKCTNWDKMCADCERRLPWWAVVVDFWSQSYAPLGRRGTIVLFAYLHALVLPLTLLVYGSYRFVTDNTPLAPRELEKQLQERDKKIVKMQEELDRALAE